MAASTSTTISPREIVFHDGPLKDLLAKSPTLTDDLLALLSYPETSFITSTGSSGGQPMDERLLKAATSGTTESVHEMASQDPSVLLATTPLSNTCLHLSSIHGHERLCREVLSLYPSTKQALLTAVNSYGETPLIAAVTSGHATLASFLLTECSEQGLNEAILKQDNSGCNALHHAIRNGHRDLALELITAEPDLSQALNNCNESPMFIAVLRDFSDVGERLLQFSQSAHAGTYRNNALHAAVRNGNAALAKIIVETRPSLAREKNVAGNTPMHQAALWNKIDVLGVLLRQDLSLGYVTSPLLNLAAFRGHVGIAQELLKHCPDAPYCTEYGWTCLHSAVTNGQTEFVEFILRVPQLRRLVNMRDTLGKTALHHAVKMCHPKIVSALLLHKDRDFTIYDKIGQPASGELSVDDAKSLNWHEVSMHIFKADPKAEVISFIHDDFKKKITDKSRKDVKYLTQTYTSNTSLVAILIATITFAAAFTLPGGYSSDAGSAGLPIMSRKLAFQAFLISDTLAMCSSLAVAFICVIAKWEDLEFLLYYRSFTKKLMWFAYLATTTAFATGLYTVLAPHLLWLAISICLLPVMLPIFTKLLGEWPVLKLRFRLGRTFKSELLDMV